MVATRRGRLLQRLVGRRLFACLELEVVDLNGHCGGHEGRRDDAFDLVP